ncbi:alpha/beta fold hydrolase [cf. Phormidesmis sp. LEGE 11477]|uniref:alpha/beta fold hydrolase n=1 Tax=cf. Phormidesmis sp. LEGE 11477 TaxID=1828680 RepID=UPI00351D86A7
MTQDQARMIVAFLSALGLDRVDVVGHDTGGAVALILAIEHASLVNRLVISNSVWAMDDPWQKSEDGARLASEIPTARFQAIEGASHWVQQDTPEQFSDALLTFLK